MPVAPTPIPDVPTPVPSTSDPGNFDTRADATLGALPGVVDGMNDAADTTYQNALQVFEKAEEISAAALVAADAAGLVGRSNSPIVVGAGTKNVTLLAAKPNLVVLNKRVVLVNISDPSIKMFGTINPTPTPTPTSFALNVVSSGSFGSGSYSSWQVIDAAFYGTAATKEELWIATSDAVAISPVSLAQAMASQPFAEPGSAGTFTFDGNAGWSFHTTVTGVGKTVGQPTNFKPGQSGRIRFVVGSGAGALAFHTAWKFSFGPPTTSAVNGVVFDISYFVHDATNIEAVYIPNLQA